MNVRQEVIPLPEGRQATLSFPAPMTLEAIEALEQATALMLRSLRRELLGRQAQDTGAIEYDSWAVCA